ncbi:MAG: hypothetical protein OSJ61_13420 [Lachnospiraceae bacterium]|nr:hypothetical protein [Lachnospiraceae bacterium]
MYTKNLFHKHLLALMLCFTILAPTISSLEQLSPKTENIAPCSDIPEFSIKN